jgi:hypothetical protein
MMGIRELGPADEASFWAEKCAELEAALSAERQTATLTAETHTLKIRALEDMVEAEAEARREAEGECGLYLTVLAWAFHQGYEAEQTSWFDEEGVEGWEWTGPDGLNLGGQIGAWDEPPTMPDGLFKALSVNCPWLPSR